MICIRNHTKPSVAPPFRLRLLGGLAVERDGVPIVSHFPRRKGARLLAYLALHFDRGRTRDSIAATLWPDQDSDHQRDSLRNELAALRSLLRKADSALDSQLLVDKQRVRINPAIATTDWADWTTELRLTINPHDGTTTSTLKQLIAQGESAGTLLPGWYDDWLTVPRLEFETLLQRALWGLARTYAEEGNDSEARDCAQRAIGIDASATVTNSAREFLNTLDHGPHQTKVRIRSERPESETAGLRPRLAVNRFFGRRSEIDQIEELVRSVIDTETDTDSAPMPALRLQRLITITGMAGVGKTRLVQEIQERLGDASTALRHLFVPLVTVLSSNDIPRAIASALGVTPEADASLLSQLGRVLRLQPTLLILDNLEHLLLTGRSLIEGVLQSLLEAAPSLIIITTSRQRIDAPFEQEIALSPLPLPDAAESDAKSDPTKAVETVLRFESIQLFEDRMRRAKSDFRVHARNATTVAALCRRLDGLPLAIELIAARAVSATPGEMLHELDMRFDLRVGSRQDLEPRDERHLTLWEAVEWSYHLLSANLRTFFAKLSVFRGGFTLESAAAVCSNGDRGDAAFALEELQKRSFVVADEDPVTDGIRFRLLETMREFGVAQLADVERSDLAYRHAMHFLTFAEEAAKHSTGQETVEWLDRQEMEHPNLTTAIDTFEANKELPAALRLVAALKYFWRVRGNGQEWADRTASLVTQLEKFATDEVAKISQATDYVLLLASGANTAARLYLVTNDIQHARVLCAKALAWAESSNDQNEIATARRSLGYINLAVGNYAEAEENLHAIVQMGREDENHAAALHSLGSIMIGRGNMTAGCNFYQMSLTLSRRRGGLLIQAVTLVALGNAYRMLNQYEEALIYVREGLAIFHLLKDPIGIARTKHVLASIYYQQGNFTEASRFADESLTEAERGGSLIEASRAIHILGMLALQNNNLATALSHLKRCLNWQLEFGWPEQQIIYHLSFVAVAMGYERQAVLLWSAVMKHYETASLILHPIDIHFAASYIAMSRAALGDAIYSITHAEGRYLPWEAVIELARNLPAIPADKNS